MLFYQRARNAYFLRRMRRARSIEAWQHTFTTEDLHNGGAMDFQLARGCSPHRRGHGYGRATP